MQAQLREQAHAPPRAGGANFTPFNHSLAFIMLNIELRTHMSGIKGLLLLNGMSVVILYLSDILLMREVRWIVGWMFDIASRQNG